MGSETTDLLQRTSRGDKLAEAELFPKVYSELHKMAARYLRQERQGHTLQATALVNEVYLKLTAQSQPSWENRAHFFGVAAQAMRRILVDHARKKGAVKRGNGIPLSALDEGLTVSPEQCALIRDLDEALNNLEKLSPRQVKVVELRFFAGMNEEEIGAALGISSRTVKRDWTMARAWLFSQLMA
jgi:RNA polymerase sigma factor (TIGR02999 family)